MPKWIIAWDFPQRPKRTFYEILRSEFGPPDTELAQKSVAFCRDDFVARRLRELTLSYGASVLAYSLNEPMLDDPEADREAREFIERIHSQRSARRGHRGAAVSSTHTYELGPAS